MNFLEWKVPKTKYSFSEGKPIASTKSAEEVGRKKREPIPEKKAKHEKLVYTQEQTLSAMEQSSREADSKETTTEAERKNAALFQIFKENNVKPFHAEKLKPLLLPIVDKIKSVVVDQFDWISDFCDIKIIFKDNSKIEARGASSEYLKGWLTNRAFNKALKKIEKDLRKKGYILNDSLGTSLLGA